ncbi:MAG: ATP synthase F1 subunit epsilon [Polyangiales bacterium]
MADLPTTLMLEVATPLGMALSVQTDSVQVPSVAGELGVLPGHLPLLAALKPGVLSYRKDGQPVRRAVGAGYVEVNADRVRLIAEFCLERGQVDVEAAHRDKQAAEARLKASKTAVADLEHQEAQRELDWAEARLLLAGGAGN